MHMAPSLSLIGTDEIIQILNATRKRYRLSSDQKLAQLLGVSHQAIYRWRRGQIDKSARILVTLVRQQEINENIENAS